MSLFRRKPSPQAYQVGDRVILHGTIVRVEIDHERNVVYTVKSGNGWDVHFLKAEHLHPLTEEQP